MSTGKFTSDPGTPEYHASDWLITIHNAYREIDHAIESSPNPAEFIDRLRERGHRLTPQVSPQFVDAMKKNTALRRFGTSEEIGEVVAFLCSSGAGYVTGQRLAVDGLVDGGAALVAVEGVVGVLAGALGAGGHGDSLA